MVARIQGCIVFVLVWSWLWSWVWSWLCWSGCAGLGVELGVELGVLVWVQCGCNVTSKRPVRDATTLLHHCLWLCTRRSPKSAAPRAWATCAAA